MSITVRLWSKQDLQSLQKDKKLATVFMNVRSFSADEIKYYPYNLRRTYVAIWGDDSEGAEPVTFYATDDKMARWFLSREYARIPDSLVEEKTRQRPVSTYAAASGKSKSKSKKSTAASVGGVR